MHDVYGIVKLQKSSNNKGFIIVSVSHVIPSIPPKCAKTREPEDERCVSQCTRHNNIRDTVPLDKLKYHSANKLALPYIT